MSVSADVLEILIYEDIGEDYWSGGGITTSTIAAKLRSMGPFASISIRINSPGGSCFDGVGIYNLLRSQGKPIDVWVDGLAASAASIVAMAGDTINIGTGAMLMIHNASIFCYGEASDLRKVADTLDSISVAAGEIYVKRTGQDAAKVKEMMDAETWLSGVDAVELGFATAVTELEPEQGAQARALAQEFGLQGIRNGFFRHAPKSLARQRPKNSKSTSPRADAYTDCTCPCTPCMDGDCTSCETEAPCTFEGCTCSQHEEMALDEDLELKYYQHRLAQHSR